MADVPAPKPRRIAPDAVEPVAKVERREAIGTANDAKKKALANIGARR